ncbi:hypothetical protein [Deinococcus sp. NW-56]|uniref:hypothetical protein n=1 Tax=Deinococcus sp. NW-56 TaxID=2080419 RepID=UPI000CF3C4FD|nr:hypothetical protein [Deinococcus sp. NW-56]
MTLAEKPTSLTGWIRGAQGDRDHWADKGKALCRKPVPVGAQLLCTEPLLPNWQRPSGHWVLYCPTCLTRVVLREGKVPFKVGDYVQSRALGMTLRGKVAGAFLDDDGVPMLNITRIWEREPVRLDGSSEDTYPHDWYRHVSECRPWDGPRPKAPARARHPRPSAPAPSDDVLPPHEVARRLEALKQQFRGRR